VFGLPPFLQQQLQNPSIHSVLNSFDVAGGPNTYTVSYTTARFRDRAPVLFRALYAALGEATERVNADPRQASQYWIEDGGSKLALDFVTAAATEAQVRWTMVPERTMIWAEFMNSVGTLKARPASWKDYFWPEAHGLDGS
jgi:NitT/TauT family transport system substrate-binding protein